MEEDKLQAVTKDEKLQVGFSYLFGWIPALYFWIQSKNKSAYVRFHTMQAILYNIVLACFSVLGGVLMVVFSVLSFIIFITLTDLSHLRVGFPDSPQALLLLISNLGSVFVYLATYIPLLLIQAVNIIAVIQGFSGRDWRYPLLAKWAEKINQRDMETSLRNEL
jgi:uncharacterized membrane protein